LQAGRRCVLVGVGSTASVSEFEYVGCGADRLFGQAEQGGNVVGAKRRLGILTHD
jgi:hypothetical protein